MWFRTTVCRTYIDVVQSLGQSQLESSHKVYNQYTKREGKECKTMSVMWTTHKRNWANVCVSVWKLGYLDIEDIQYLDSKW